MKRLIRRLWFWLTRKPAPTATPTDAGRPPQQPPEQGLSAIAPSTRAERSLIVGVDFGTSSTKVIWQDLSDNHFETFRWRETEQCLAALLLPSTIVIRGNAIHFGLADRDVRESDIRLSSIKLCVLCRTNLPICRCGSPVAQQGVVRVPGLETAHPASVFACLFLANVFREVERGLETQFPNDELVLIWNIGCPMDHLDETDRKGEWERMAGVAMELHRDVSNPASTSLLAEVAESINGFVVPAPGERNYFVQPEGLAAVKAFLESPHAESKTYAIVDVGAGTTEVSFFFNGRIMTERGQPLCPSYLADSTTAIGGGKIDLELAQAWNCTAEDARRRKEAGEIGLPFVPSIREICLQYEETCREILRQHRLTAANDKRFDLFVIGGGGRLRTLQDEILGCSMPGGFVREVWRQLKPPRSLKDGGAIQAHYDFLANACGLASSLDWEYYPPRDVPPMTPPRERRPAPDLDEYYPK